LLSYSLSLSFFSRFHMCQSYPFGAQSLQFCSKNYTGVNEWGFFLLIYSALVFRTARRRSLALNQLGPQTKASLVMLPEQIKPSARLGLDLCAIALRQWWTNACCIWVLLDGCARLSTSFVSTFLYPVHFSCVPYPFSFSASI